MAAIRAEAMAIMPEKQGFCRGEQPYLAFRHRELRHQAGQRRTGAHDGSVVSIKNRKPRFIGPCPDEGFGIMLDRVANKGRTDGKA